MTMKKKKPLARRVTSGSLKPRSAAATNQQAPRTDPVYRMLVQIVRNTQRVIRHGFPLTPNAQRLFDRAVKTLRTAGWKG